MNRALAFSGPAGAPGPGGEPVSLLLSALQYACLADTVTLRALCRSCTAWIPTMTWCTPLRMLFALPVADGLALLRCCTLPGCLRPQSITHLGGGLLIAALRELAYFPSCQEASLLLVLFRYCVAQAALGSVGLRLLDWQLEVHDALQQPPIVRLYSEPWIYYRAVQGLAPGAVTSAGMLPHHELLSRFGAGRRLQPSGWVYALVRTAAPFSRAEHSLRAWLALPHSHRPDQL